MLFTVYPRWRGEHFSIAVASERTAGLSPLARGTRYILDQIAGWLRFIPAGAGNTTPHLQGNSSIAVYPRWRGEHAICLPVAALMSGLSPLARGTLKDGQLILWYERFIPAGAGNTNDNDDDESEHAVYPRWRGEHSQNKALNASRCGLSPLARGTHVFDDVFFRQQRFIPAGAGNTGAGNAAHADAPVYPRWRGEHHQLEKRMPFRSGLSPLARGTPTESIELQMASRFIPAGAGNTEGAAWAHAEWPVYPRWRGEHRNWSQKRRRLRGLSPLARGTL